MKKFLSVCFAALLALIAGAALADEAAEITDQCKFKTTSTRFKYTQMTDGKYTTVWKGNKVKHSSIQLTAPSSTNIYGLYVCFATMPESYEFQVERGGKWETYLPGDTRFYHVYCPIPEGADKVRVYVTSAASFELFVNEIFAFGPGDTPDWVQRWEPSPEKADILFLSTHPDDELIFFGGGIPTYAAELNKRVVVAYMSYSNTTRRSELLNSLWALGVRQYPDIGTFRDSYQKTVAVQYKNLGGETKVNEWAVALFRRYRPEVVVTQDVNGEYGHPMHKVVAETAQRAYDLAASSDFDPESLALYGPWQVKKLYLHLWPENQIRMNWEFPLSAFGGKTGNELADEAYRVYHVTQRASGMSVAETGAQYDNHVFGLVRTTVGPDVVGGDFLENIPADAPATVVPVIEAPVIEAPATEAPAPAAPVVPETPITEAPPAIAEAAPAVTAAPAEAVDFAALEADEDSRPASDDQQDAPDISDDQAEAAAPEVEVEVVELPETQPTPATTPVTMPLLIGSSLYPVPTATPVPTVNAPAPAETPAVIQGTPMATDVPAPAEPLPAATPAPAWAAYMPPLNARGYLDEGEYVLADETNGLYLFVNQTLKVVIQRKEDLSEKKHPLVWFDAEIWCDVAAGEIFHTLQVDPAKMGKARDYCYNTATKYNAVFATNTDYYTYRIGSTRRTGIVVRDGKILYDDRIMKETTLFPNLDTLAFYPDGRLESLHSFQRSAQEYIDLGAYDIYSFGPCLVQNGELTERAINANESYNPRYAVGMIEPGHYVAILCEGRLARSKGVQMLRLAKMMQERGCQMAINLDGGQTCIMCFMGKQINQIPKINGSNKVRKTSEILAIGTSTQVGSVEFR